MTIVFSQLHAEVGLLPPDLRFRGIFLSSPQSPKKIVERNCDILTPSNGGTFPGPWGREKGVTFIFDVRFVWLYIQVLGIPTPLYFGAGAYASNVYRWNVDTPSAFDMCEEVLMI